MQNGVYTVNFKASQHLCVMFCLVIHFTHVISYKIHTLKIFLYFAIFFGTQ